MIDFIETKFSTEIAREVEKFQKETDALITGSVVLKVLANEPWDVKDLDILVPLNEKSIDAFEKLVRRIVPPKERDEDEEDEFDDDDDYQDFTGNAHITKFDSLNFRSFQPNDDAAMFIPTEALTKEQKKQEKKDAKNFKLMREKFRNIRDMCENYGYNKHVRAIYFACDSLIGSKKSQMDVIFVPEQDILQTGSLINWMKYNFDFQICANAILTKSAYCLAPQEIANRVAYLRLDQYCCDVKRVPKVMFDENASKAKKKYIWKSREDQMLEEGMQLIPDVRWSSQFDDYGMCNCQEIAPNRVRKYEKRGYHVETGTCAQYKEWRKMNNL